jgi:benzoyl-CoA reductase/2-hydroxyglutaryl-CoA dehydratase subunit BcrC/BadD/HgdB
MIMSGQVMDKAEHNALLKDAINQIQKRKIVNHAGPRLMLLGSEIGDTRLVSFIESIGTTIVADRLSMGSNYMWNNIIPQRDRLLAIGFRYMDKPRSPVKDESFRRRVNEIVAMAIDYNVEGVIYLIHRFCLPHQQDRPAILKSFKQRLIPVHEIEYDGTFPDKDIQTRIQSFVDMLKK